MPYGYYLEFNKYRSAVFRYVWDSFRFKKGG